MLDAFPGHVYASIELYSRCLPSGDEQLAKYRHGHERSATEHRLVDRHVAPPQRLEVLFSKDALNPGLGIVSLIRVLGQEGNSGDVLAWRWKRETGHVPVEPVGDLDQDPGAVAGVDIGPLGPAVLQIAERANGLRHDLVCGRARHVAHERDSAGVVFIARIIETLAPGLQAGHPHVLRSCRGELGRRWPGRQQVDASHRTGISTTS